MRRVFIAGEVIFMIIDKNILINDNQCVTMFSVMKSDVHSRWMKNEGIGMRVNDTS